MLSLNPNDRPSISEVFNVLKDIKPGEAIPPTIVDPIGEKPKKPVLRFGPGLKPSGTKGIPPSGTPISKALEIETKTPKIPEEPKPSTSGSGLRGSGLKIADKE
jgi:hypothetical protein